MTGIEKLINQVVGRFSAGDYEPPVALMDRPNTVMFPVMEASEAPVQGVESPLGEFAMQLSEQAMSMFGGGAGGLPGGGMGGEDPMGALMGAMGGGMPGGPMPGGQAMGGDPMMGGVDAMGMMMGGGMGAGPNVGPLPEESLPSEVM